MTLTQAPADQVGVTPAATEDTMLLAEEMDRMTLQIGLVGRDGIMLASDRLVNVIEGDAATLSMRSKFFFNDDVVCCWSGDSVARRAANYVRDLSWAQNNTRDRDLRSCADRAWSHHFGDTFVPEITQRMQRKVLVAFTADCSLWELNLSASSLTERVQDKTVAGSARTTVRHLINNYVPPASQPVSRLVVIAAHAILMGHREQNSDIAGLEVAIIRRGESPQFLTDYQERELERISTDIHDLLGRELLREFELRPAPAR
jgi:20S proteasome alpha/beta subunit